MCDHRGVNHATRARAVEGIARLSKAELDLATLFVEMNRLVARALPNDGAFEYSGLSMSEVSPAVLFGAIKCIAGRGMFNSPEGVQFLSNHLAQDLKIEFNATAELVEERRSPTGWVPQ